MTDITEDPFFSTGQVARLFGVKPYTIRKWTKDGQLSAVKINGQLKYRKSEVNRYAQLAYGDDEKNEL
jgi:excisionase family DNA binding protein